MKYSIVYPSGRRLSLRGAFAIRSLPGVGRNPVIVDGVRLHVLDPRAVITELGTGMVVYTVDSIPRDELTQDMRRWLQAREKPA